MKVKRIRHWFIELVLIALALLFVALLTYPVSIPTANCLLKTQKVVCSEAP